MKSARGQVNIKECANTSDAVLHVRTPSNLIKESRKDRNCQKDSHFLLCSYAKLRGQVSRAALADRPLPVMAKMSALYQGRVMLCGPLACTHGHTATFFFLLIMNMDISHKWAGFALCAQLQVGLVMSCRRRGRAQFFTKWSCCFISHGLLLLVFAICSHDGHQSQQKHFCSLFATSEHSIIYHL